MIYYLNIDTTKGFGQKKSAGTKTPSSYDHYMRNASILEKSRRIPGNGSGFWNQDHPPAIKLIYYLQIDTTKGLLSEKICWNQNPIELWPLHAKC
jgi:hypothetical protein